MSEGLTSTIQTLETRASGFWDKARFKPAVFFHCGGLDLCPRSFRKNR